MRSAPSPLVRPPWSRVHRVQLIRREIREYLPSTTVELLLSAGEHVVEGSAELAPGGVSSGRVYATAMVTIDLRACAGAFREPADAATAERVAELLAGHAELHQRLVARVGPRLAEIAGIDDPKELLISLETEVRAEGTTIYVDADVMGSPRSARRG
jgi:hypothetical protein